jgi:hypothetical protein
MLASLVLGSVLARSVFPRAVANGIRWIIAQSLKPYWTSAIMGLILPPRRPNRSYPRAVKIKMSNYPRNRRSPSGGVLI